MLRTKGPIVVNITLTILFTVCVVAAGSVVAADTAGSLAPQVRLGQAGERAEQTVQPGARRTKVDGDYKPQIDCENLADSFIRVPDDVAAVCSRAVLNRGAGRAPTDTAYAIDIYPGSNFVNFILNNFSGQTTVGPVTGDFFAVDFDVAATTLYGIENATQMLGTFDLTTGAFTAIGACVPTPAADTWTGLSIDMNNVAWASSTDGITAHLYTVDLVTGAATHITTVPNLALLIDIAECRDEIRCRHARASYSRSSGISSATPLATIDA